MEEIIQNYASGIFALLGTIAGATITFIGTWILKNQEAKTRLLEKILDRRIQAHEKVIEISKLFRNMVSLGFTEDSGELARVPVIMASAESINDFLTKFTQAVGESSTWISNDVTRELNFAQDYLVNLHEFLRNTNPDDYHEVGRIIRQDFIDISTNLEKLSVKYLTKDLTKFKLDDLSKWHKYPIDVTKKRLNETALFKKKDEIIKSTKPA